MLSASIEECFHFICFFIVYHMYFYFNTIFIILYKISFIIFFNFIFCVSIYSFIYYCCNIQAIYILVFICFIFFVFFLYYTIICL